MNNIYLYTSIELEPPLVHPKTPMTLMVFA